MYALDSLGLAALGLKPTSTGASGVNSGDSGVNSARFAAVGMNAGYIDRSIKEIE